MKENPRVKQEKCPKCGHNRMWIPRGLAFSYRLKCCKCGHRI